MKKHNLPKLQLSIPEPCHEKWSAMTPVEGGRFCHQCDRHIVNFTDMSDHELAFYYQKHEGKICGVFRPDQLDRPIALPVAPTPSNKWKVAAAVAAGLLVSGGVSGQHGLERKTPFIYQIHEKKEAIKDTLNSRIVKGIVVDKESGEPLIYTSIWMKGTKFGTSTDLDGQFTLFIPNEYQNPPLEFSYVGYETITIETFDWKEDQVVEMQEFVLGELVVEAKNGYNGQELHENTFSKQVKTVRAKVTKITPNPFTNWLTIQLKTNRKGLHIINLYNLEGQLLYAETFQLVKGKQTLSLDNLPNNLAAGSYILQVTRDNEILLTEKVVKAK